MFCNLVRLLSWMAPVVLAGCALGDLRPGEIPPRFVSAGERVADCAQFFNRLDHMTAKAGVADAQDARVAGFPYLRVNRFLAGDWRPGPDDAAFGDWARQLRWLDARARWFEINNLAADNRTSIAGQTNGALELHQRVADCGGILLIRDLDHRPTRNRLYQAAVKPDDYRLIYRAAGIYPLTSIPFFAGVKHLHKVISRDFDSPLASLPVSGRLLRYAPQAAQIVNTAEVAAILQRAAGNLLGMPLPSPGDAARLLETFAPVFEIDVVRQDDRIGWPQWTRGKQPSTDTSKPVVFTYLSHVRFEAKTLLQLNYVVWFPARPSTGIFDLLAGRLDGINWRVTLDADGTPLLYDSVHNCGCYHLFIPSEKLQSIAASDGFEEPALVPQTLSWRPERLVIRIASRTHYIQRAYHDSAIQGKKYVFANYDELRSLKMEVGQRRSLFGEDGLVAGTERPERWLFWPMGVESPGAMRQRGRHATAFVGRRHFDDPALVSRYFRRKSP